MVRPSTSRSSREGEPPVRSGGKRSRVDFDMYSNKNRKSQPAGAGTGVEDSTLAPTPASSHAHALPNHAHSLSQHAHASCFSAESQLCDKSRRFPVSHQPRPQEPQPAETEPRPASAELQASSDGSPPSNLSSWSRSSHQPRQSEPRPAVTAPQSAVSASLPPSPPPPPPPPPQPNSAGRTPPSVGADLPTKRGGARVAEPRSALSLIHI